MPKTERAIFKQGSATFFISSLFFPKEVKADVFDLYSFVRVADDYVDQVPADREGFFRLRKLWDSGDTPTDDSLDAQVIQNMRRVSAKHDFDPAWTAAFLDVMQSDLEQQRYVTINDSLGYIYGSAEVIGLMMAKIMQLPSEAHESAQLQGRAMQMINFIRDINEDNDLGRQYFPSEDLEQFNLPDLTKETALAQPDDFTRFIRYQLDRYDIWQADAYAGYKYIPRRLRIPLQTATDMYNWTAEQIRTHPFIVFEKKVKPHKKRVIVTAVRNTLIKRQ